jgi:hypothetical protein
MSTRALSRADWDVESAVELLFEGAISDSEEPGPVKIGVKLEARVNRVNRVQAPPPPAPAFVKSKPQSVAHKSAQPSERFNVKQRHLRGVSEQIVFVVASAAAQLFAEGKLVSTIRWGQIARFKRMADGVTLKLMPGKTGEESPEIVLRTNQSQRLFESIKRCVTELASQRASSKKSMAKNKDSQGRCTVRPRRLKDGELDKSSSSTTTTSTSSATGSTSPRARADKKKTSLVDLYALLFARVPFSSISDEALAKEFSDKELRVLMGMNKMLINDFDPVSGKYTEKTKQNKIIALLPLVSQLASPDKLREPAKPKRRPRKPDGTLRDPAGQKPAAPPPGKAPLPRAPAHKQTPMPASYAKFRPAVNKPMAEAAPQPAPESACAMDLGDVVGSSSASEPDSPVWDPAEGGLHMPRSYGNFDFVGAYNSTDKKVTPLAGFNLSEHDVDRASGYVCASMAVFFHGMAEDGALPSLLSTASQLPRAVQPGIEAYRRASTERKGMDAVITDSYLGDALRIIDIRAYSRSLRYPSNLGVVVNQLEQVPGSMVAFLYGHRNFRRAETSGTVVFIGCVTPQEERKVFVMVDPRPCSKETGLPKHGGSPVLLAFTTATELQKHLEFLLKGEGGADPTSVDWQASFLEVVPTQERAPSLELIGADDEIEEDMWLSEWEETPRGARSPQFDDMHDLDLDLDQPFTKCMDSMGSRSPPRSPALDPSRLVSPSPQRLSDEDALPPDNGMQRTFSFDDLEAVLPSIEMGISQPNISEVVQEQIDQECRKQASEVAWQQQMSDRVLKSRQAHERRRRQAEQAQAEMQRDSLSETDVSDSDEEEDAPAPAPQTQSVPTANRAHPPAAQSNSLPKSSNAPKSLPDVTPDMNQFEAAGVIYARQTQAQAEKQRIKREPVAILGKARNAQKRIAPASPGRVAFKEPASASMSAADFEKALIGKDAKHSRAPPKGESRKRRVSVGKEASALSTLKKKLSRKPSPPKIRVRVANPYSLDGAPAARRQISPMRDGAPWTAPLAISKPAPQHVVDKLGMPVSPTAAAAEGFAAMSVTRPLGKAAANATRYTVQRGERAVLIDVGPTGVSVHDPGAATGSAFHHLTSIQSWRVIREANVPTGDPIGFRLQFTDRTELEFTTPGGRAISDTLMTHARGLATLMHGGMHVRGSAMVN